MDIQETQWLSVAEFANRAGRTERAIYKAIKAGRVQAVRAESSALRIAASELLAFVGGQAVPEPVQEPPSDELERVRRELKEARAEVEAWRRKAGLLAEQAEHREALLRRHERLLAEAVDVLADREPAPRATAGAAVWERLRVGLRRAATG